MEMEMGREEREERGERESAVNGVPELENQKNKTEGNAVPMGTSCLLCPLPSPLPSKTTLVLLIQHIALDWISLSTYPPTVRKQ